MQEKGSSTIYHYVECSPHHGISTRFSVLLLVRDLYSNLHAPTGGRATKNESDSGAIGIPEFVPPIPNGYQTQSGQEADEP